MLQPDCGCRITACSLVLVLTLIPCSRPVRAAGPIHVPVPCVRWQRGWGQAAWLGSDTAAVVSLLFFFLLLMGRSYLQGLAAAPPPASPGASQVPFATTTNVK